jgi:hypothetical protein
MRGALVCLLIACASPPKREGPIAPRAPGIAKRAPLPAVHRVRGDVRGGFEVSGTTLTAFAPILVRFWIENTSSAPFTFQDGGDYFSNGARSYTWLVTAENGDVECDLRGRPEGMGGGGGFDHKTLKPGQRFEHWLAPQFGCDALTKPGLHHLRGVKIMTDYDHGCSGPTVPDVTVDPPDDRGQQESAECMAYLKSVPAIATELEVEILPYHRDDVRLAIKKSLAAHPQELPRHALGTYASWAGDHFKVKQDYNADVTVRLRAVMDGLP